MSGSVLGDSDMVQALLYATNHQNLFLFTNQGRILKLKVYQIPEGGRRAKGAHISNLLDLHKDEFVATALGQRDLNFSNSFLFITKGGVVKRSEIELYKNLKTSGMIALSMKKGDELIAVREVNENSRIMLMTKQGYAIHFSCTDVRSMGRNATGVKGISLRSDDEVVSGVVIEEQGPNNVLTVSEYGFGKRTPLDQYRLQSRGGKGIISMKPSSKTGTVLGAMMVNEEDQIIILTSENKMIRIAVNEIRVCNRAAQGVKLVSMDNGGGVVCFDRIVPENGDET
jgi:DNA gyrase subunit A